MSQNPSVGPLYAPFTAPPTVEQTRPTNPTLRTGRKTLKWNWDLMDLALDGAGRIPRISGAEAIVTWCLKTVLTERFMHAVYTHNYGVEFDSAMQGGRPRAITEQRARQTIAEALMQHPEVSSVQDIGFSWNGDEVFITFNVYSLANDEPFQLQLAVDGSAL